MIDIYFGKKTDGTPVLSKSNIEADVENILLDYNNGNVLNEPQPTPLDELTEFYYGLNMDFKSFQNIDILGVSVFTNGNINIFENNIPKTTMVKKNTIILSEDITNTGRSRFTHGHELGHFTYHVHLYSEDDNQLSLFGKLNNIQVCYKIGHFLSSEKKYLQSQSEWIEWQADYFSACLLMPKKSVDTYLRLNGYIPNGLSSKYLLDYLSQNDKNKLIEDMSEFYQTSKQATEIRLKELWYI